MSIVSALRSDDGLPQQLGWKPHPIQREIIEDDTRNQVVAGGRRAAKSNTGGHKLLPYAFSALKEMDELAAKDQRREYWIVGPEYSDSEKEFRVAYNSFRRLGVPFDKPGTYNNPHNGDMHISLWNGLFLISAASAKYPDTLVGEGLSGVVLSEAAKLKPSTWPKFIRPMLSDFDGWSFMSSTPEGRNWFYRMWQAGQDPLRPDWRSWRIPAWENPYVYKNMKIHGAKAELAIRALQKARARKVIPDQLPVISGLRKIISDERWASMVDKTWLDMGIALGLDPELVSMVIDLSDELFNQEVAAQFNEFVGRVFKEFDEEIHVGDFTYEPSWSTFAALDYGFTNPFVWLLIQIDPHSEQIRVLDEYYEIGKTTEKAGAEIQDRGLAPGSLLGFYPDPAEPDRSRQLSGLLQVPSFGGTGGALADRLEWIRRKLKPDEKVAHLDPNHPEWAPQLMVNRRCKDTIREFNIYRYPKTAEEMTDENKDAPEVPLKKHDHTPEALGRFMVGYFGSPWAVGAAPARVSRAKIGRRRHR